MQDPHIFGDVLKTVRGDLGLSQAGLADALRSTQRHISFLETGRSLPSQSFIARLCTDLNLNAGQRATLYQASGRTSPFRRRDFDSDEITRTLDMIEARVLNNWPFPALVLDPHWTILRMNAVGALLFEPFLTNKNEAPNLLAIMMSPSFLEAITNWEEASTALFFRLQKAAAQDVSIRRLFNEARARGIFDHVASRLQSDQAVPVFVPVCIALPGGIELKITSLLGQLATVQDAIVEGFEIELMLPVDDNSEKQLKALTAMAG